MSRFPEQYVDRLMNPAASQARAESQAKFMNGVYAWMCAGLATTAGVAYLVSQWIVGRVLETGEWPLPQGLMIGLILAQLALVWVISAAVNKVNATVASVLFLVYAAMLGVSLSPIVLVYTAQSLAATFFVTAGMFGITSLWAYVTKTDLSKFGSFLFMALIGFVLASVVNWWLASSMLGWVLTYAGIVLFVGLTAYDTQKIREIGYATADNPAMAARLSIVGSLSLYLDFVNLFLLLLRLMGNRR